MSSPPMGLTIGSQHKWRVGNLIGQGACGSVHELEPIDRPPSSLLRHYVIKIAAVSPNNKTAKRGKKTTEERNADTIYHEHMLLSYRLSTLRGIYIPELPSYGGPPSYGDVRSGSISYRYLVLERMSSSLASWAPLIDGKHITLGSLALKMLECIQKLHELNLLHIDLKMDNFMVTCPVPSGTTLHNGDDMAKCIRLIDFGLAESFYNIKHREDIPIATMVGTPLYASCNVMEGRTPSRRDDLESLGYVLMDLLLMNRKGSSECQLPWKDAINDKEILCLKQEALSSGKWLYDNTGQNDEDTKIIHEYLTRVRALGYSKRPNYEQLKAILGKLCGGRRHLPALQHKSPFHAVLPQSLFSTENVPVQKGALPSCGAITEGRSDAGSDYFTPELSFDEQQEPENSLPKGDQGVQGIVISKGIYKGILAFPTGKQTAQMISVRLEGPDGRDVKIRKTSIDTPTPPTAAATTTRRRITHTQSASARVSGCQTKQHSATCESTMLRCPIVGGVYKGRIGFLQRTTAKMVFIYLDSPDGDVVRITKASWGGNTATQDIFTFA